MSIVAPKKVLSFVILLFSPFILAMDNAVILLYHHVSESTPSSTSVTSDIFKQHMNYLQQHHQVLPLETVISKLKKGEPLPDKTVVITFDDGYINIHDNAHPILFKHKFPYTVFVNPSLINQRANQLNWQHLKKMSEEGATFANHGYDHQHLLQRSNDESKKSWLSRVMDNINRAEQELERHLGYSLRYLAYPYGEFDLSLKKQLIKNGYTGFAQFSGAVASHSDFGALPRYPAAGIYSDLEKLKVKLTSLAMPVHEPKPKDPLIDFNSSEQSLSFSIKDPDVELQKLACFYNNETLSLNRNRDSIKADVPGVIPPGRSRVNCTAPSIKYPDRFYWYSQPWFVADKEGEWLN